jgi:hypothetical protein
VSSRPDHAGISVAEALRVLIERLQPGGYLEITVHSEPVAVSIARNVVAIRPSGDDTLVAPAGMTRLFVFHGSPAAFFDRHDPRLLLDGPIDLAFLDGFPLFDAALRDFCNLERAAHSETVVLMNNCLPLDIAMAGRDPEDRVRREGSAHPDWWTGDLWKLLLIFVAYRPDLKIYAFDAQPAGLLAVTNLDPTSTVIPERFDAIIAEYRDLANEGDALKGCLDVLDILAARDIADVLGHTRPAEPVPVGSGPPSFRFVDPAQLPVIDLPALAGGLAEGRLTEQPDTPRAYFRAAPAFIDDPARRGIIPPFGNDTIRYRPSAVLSVKHAELVGYRSIVTASGLLVHDESEVEAWDMGRLAAKLSRTDDDFLNEGTGLAPAGDGRFALDRRGRDTIGIDDPVIVLSSNEPGNYGSWIYRILPKLYSVRRLGLDGLKILVHAPEPHHKVWLTALGVPWDAVIHQDIGYIYKIRHGIVPTMRNIMPYLESGGRQMFEQLRQRYGVPQTDRRIYVSRLGWSRAGSLRALMNEAELVARLAAAGFDVIEPEKMSLAEQIETFSSARVIVGPAGSALYNVGFCQPGARIVDIESEPHWVALHSCLFASLGHVYGIFVGETDPTDPVSLHKRWTVDIDALMRRLEWFAR